MKLDQESLAYIQLVVKTAEIAKIGNVIIEPGRIRGIDEDRTVLILEEEDVQELPFGSIGVNRIPIFTSRFELIKNVANAQIDVLVEGQATNTYARSLTMKADGIKIDYRCANPATIQAPKAFNDAVRYHARMTSDAVGYMSKGQSAMGADEVLFVGTPEGIAFEISDINSDKFSYQISDELSTAIPDDKDPIRFSHRYPLKTIHTLFKHNPDGRFSITNRGMLKINVNGISVYVLPRN